MTSDAVVLWLTIWALIIAVFILAMSASRPWRDWRRRQRTHRFTRHTQQAIDVTQVPPEDRPDWGAR